MRGLSVFTRPSSTSGNPVMSSTERTAMPSAASSCAVPPVETISTPSSASPRAKSMIPRLSETLSSARRTRTSPGAVVCGDPAGSVVDTDAPLDHDAPAIRSLEPHRAAGDELDRPGQQPVLDRVNLVLDLGDGRRIRKPEGLLKDDRAGVGVLVHEVDRDPGHPDAVLHRALDRM